MRRFPSTAVFHCFIAVNIIVQAGREWFWEGIYCQVGETWIEGICEVVHVLVSGHFEIIQ